MSGLARKLRLEEPRSAPIDLRCHGGQTSQLEHGLLSTGGWQSQEVPRPDHTSERFGAR